jgi:hypothetical protein
LNRRIKKSLVFKSEFLDDESILALFVVADSIPDSNDKRGDDDARKETIGDIALSASVSQNACKKSADQSKSDDDIGKIDGFYGYIRRGTDRQGLCLSVLRE